MENFGKHLSLFYSKSSKCESSFGSDWNVSPSIQWWFKNRDETNLLWVNTSLRQVNYLLDRRQRFTFQLYFGKRACRGSRGSKACLDSFEIILTFFRTTLWAFLGCRTPTREPTDSATNLREEIFFCFWNILLCECGVCQVLSGCERNSISSHGCGRGHSWSWEGQCSPLWRLYPRGVSIQTFERHRRTHGVQVHC